MSADPASLCWALQQPGEAVRVLGDECERQQTKIMELFLEIARRSNIIGQAAALLDTGHVKEARDVLALGFANDAAEKP